MLLKLRKVWLLSTNKILDIPNKVFWASTHPSETEKFYNYTHIWNVKNLNQIKHFKSEKKLKLKVFEKICQFMVLSRSSKFWNFGRRKKSKSCELSSSNIRSSSSSHLSVQLTVNKFTIKEINNFPIWSEFNELLITDWSKRI
jgi:hypothetical protein